MSDVIRAVVHLLLLLLFPLLSLALLSLVQPSSSLSRSSLTQSVCLSVRLTSALSESDRQPQRFSDATQRSPTTHPKTKKGSGAREESGGRAAVGKLAAASRCAFYAWNLESHLRMALRGARGGCVRIYERFPRAGTRHEARCGARSCCSATSW